MTALATSQTIGQINPAYLPYNSRGQGGHGDAVIDHVEAGKRANKVISDLKVSAQYCHISRSHSRLAIRIGDEKPVVFILDSHLFRTLLQHWGMYDDTIQSRHAIELASVILNWIEKPEAKTPYDNGVYSDEYRQSLRDQLGEAYQIICDVIAKEPETGFFEGIKKKKGDDRLRRRRRERRKRPTR